MNPETLAALTAAVNRIAADKERKEIARKAKLYGNAGVMLFRTETGIGASIPAAMTGNKLLKFEDKYEEKINEFKESDEKFKKL